MDRSTGDKFTKSEIFGILEMSKELIRTAVEMRCTVVELRHSTAETRRFAVELRHSAAELRGVKICKVSLAATGL